jgi:hypothetical protein
MMKPIALPKFLVFLALSLTLSGTARGDSDGEHDRMMGQRAASEHEPQLQTADDLSREVMALRRRVAVLEALKPTFTSFMPSFAERFHVMHRAGDAADWALAAHEVDEMERLARVSIHIDTKLGALMQAFMGGNLARLRESIEHRDSRAFQAALKDTVTSCNGCHTASGSTVVVTLNVDDSLSMRHPHALRRTTVPKHHRH